MVMQTNRAIFRGSLVQLPVFSHETGGKRFIRFFLEVPGLSGALDTMPVVTPECVLDSLDLSGGELLAVSGQLRTHNVRQDGRRKLLNFLYAESITAEDGAPANELSLTGTLCREPV